MLVLGCTSNFFLIHKNIEKGIFEFCYRLELLFSQFMKEVENWYFQMLVLLIFNFSQFTKLLKIRIFEY